MGLLDEIKNNLDQDYFDMDKYRAEQAAKEAAEAEKAAKEQAEKPEEPESPAAEEKPAETPAGEKENPAAAEAPAESAPAPKKKKKKKKKNVNKSEKELQELKDALDDALDEDLSDLDEFRDISDDVSTAVRKPTFKRNIYFATGILVSLMALIVFAFSIAYIVNFIGNIANNTRQKEVFIETVYPLVIADTASFDTVADLSGDTVLTAAIWDIILFEDTSAYTYEFGNVIVPEADVEYHATQMFGEGLTFEHKNLGDITLTFYYNAETKCYIIPVSPQYFSYTPKIEDIRKSGDTYTIMVGYIAPTPSWRLLRHEEEEITAKYLEYTLRKTNSGYIIVSAKEIEGAGIGDKHE